MKMKKRGIGKLRLDIKLAEACSEFSSLSDQEGELSTLATELDKPTARRKCNSTIFGFSADSINCLSDEFRSKDRTDDII